MSFMDEDVIENALRTKSLLEIRAKQGIESEKQVEVLQKNLKK